MRRLILVILISSLSLQSFSIFASGIPVVDVVSIVQDSVQYTKEIVDFSEQVRQGIEQAAQGVMLGNQYIQMLEDYIQTLKEYAHYIDQLRSLKQFISDPDWEAITKIIVPSWGDGVQGLIAALDYLDPNFSSQLDTILELRDFQPESVTDVLHGLETVLGVVTDNPELKENYGRVHARYESYKDLMKTVSYNVKASDDMRDRINKNVRQVRNLGDQSDLATLQMQAMQNTMIMQQLDQSNTIANQILMRSELEQAIRASETARNIKKYQNTIERQLDSVNANAGIPGFDTSGF